MKYVKDLLKIANDLDRAGLFKEADALDQIASQLISQAGTWENIKGWVGKKMHLPAMYGEKSAPAGSEEEAAPAKIRAIGLSLGGKVYSSRAELDAIGGNERWLKTDELIAALERSGRVSKDKIHAMKSNAGTETWGNAVNAAVEAGLISP